MTADLDTRRKRLRFRCWHRGTKELDLLLGSFADRHLTDLDGGQLGRLEALLEVPEPLLYLWVTGQGTPEAPYDHDVMALLRAFRFAPATAAGAAATP